MSNGPLIVFVALSVIVILGISLWLFGRISQCPYELERFPDGSLILKPGGQRFADMNEFQTWWGATGHVSRCPLPRLTGATKEKPVLESRGGHHSDMEELWPNTPIYKVDDYEFSRVFGYERGGHMVVPRQNYNLLMEGRQFDWADLPLSADGKKKKYKGLTEGFSAAGDLVREATAMYGSPHGPHGNHDTHDREEKAVAAMVRKAYADDPDWEPVLTKTGPNNWEVNELRPRSRQATPTEPPASERIVDTENDKVDIGFRYEEDNVVGAAIDPPFNGLEQARKEGQLPWTVDKDPFYGPVPGMERMMGPTLDHKNWY
jgi:hypothetical protein